MKTASAEATASFGSGRGATILYFGDFDPAGDDMVRSLRERLAFFGCEPEIVKSALTLEDVRRFDLPPDLTKPTDTRRAAFVAKYGDLAVELDALPIEVLEVRLREEVEARMDMGALDAVFQQEDADRQILTAALTSQGSPPDDGSAFG